MYKWETHFEIFAVVWIDFICHSTQQGYDLLKNLDFGKKIGPPGGGGYSPRFDGGFLPLFGREKRAFSALFPGRPKKNFGHIIFRSHPERHFKLSYAPIAQCMWSGWAEIQILGQKHHVLAQNRYFLVVQEFSKVVRPFGLIKGFQMRYHMTPYL